MGQAVDSGPVSGIEILRLAIAVLDAEHEDLAAIHVAAAIDVLEKRTEIPHHG